MQRETPQGQTQCLVDPNEVATQPANNIRLESGLLSPHTLYVAQEGTQKIIVKSRNALAHEQKFHSQREQQENKPDDLSKEIANINTRVALMLALALGYRGAYWDAWEEHLTNIIFPT